MALYLGDVNSNLVTSSNTVVGGPARVRGIYYTANADVGAITIKDGGAGSTTVAVFITASNSSGNIIIPGDGILCSSNVYVDLANVSSATVFYG